MSLENAYNAQKANQNKKPWKTDGHTNTSFMRHPVTDLWIYTMKCLKINQVSVVLDGI